jgi:hypothetical protein
VPHATAEEPSAVVGLPQRAAARRAREARRAPDRVERQRALPVDDLLGRVLAVVDGVVNEPSRVLGEATSSSPISSTGATTSTGTFAIALRGIAE